VKQSLTRSYRCFRSCCKNLVHVLPARRSNNNSTSGNDLHPKRGWKFIPKFPCLKLFLFPRSVAPANNCRLFIFPSQLKVRTVDQYFIYCQGDYSTTRYDLVLRVSQMIGWMTTLPAKMFLPLSTNRDILRYASLIMNTSNKELFAG
jgi:hypothetical protein